MVMITLPIPEGKLTAEERKAVDGIGKFFGNDMEKIADMLSKRTEERNDCIEAILNIAIPALEHAIEIIEQDTMVPGPMVQTNALRKLRELVR